MNSDIPSEAKIQERAYELFLLRGGEDGHDVEDWLAAEQELHAESELNRTPEITVTEEVAFTEQAPDPRRRLEHAAGRMK
jgi:hypothetical protein